MKKILALLLALIMLLSMGIVAFATEDEPAAPAAPEYDHPLTVNGLSEGDTVKFYKVIEWVGETTDHSDVSGWKAISPYDTVLTQQVLTEMLVGVKDDPATEDVDETAAPTGLTSEIAGQLAALATGEGESGTIADDGTATLDNDSAGMWMALVTPADANTIYNPVFVSADYNKEAGEEGTVALSDTYEGDAVAKKSTLTLTKTAENADDYNGDDGDTTAVGDTVSFTVTTKIPGYGEVYVNPHFVLKDELEALELDETSVNLTKPAGLQKMDETHTVEAGTDGATEDNAWDYKVETATNGYTITFAKGYLKTVKAATDVEVEYDAIVTTDAENAINEEDNTVTIEYSHNPNDQSDYDVKKDTTQHYTFSLDAEGLGEGADETINGKKTSELVKIGLDAAGNPITETTYKSEIVGSESHEWQGPLEGAVFGLYTDEACGEDDLLLQATTGEDGRMNFAGLDAGTYYLKEISAPAGYVTNTTVHTVVISAELEPITVTQWFKDGAWSETDNGGKEVSWETEILKSYTVKVDGEDTATYTFTNDTENGVHSTEINWEEAEIEELPFDLPNIKGVELPSTGGIGTTIFYVAGSIMVLAAAILLVTKRRMNAGE